MDLLNENQYKENKQFKGKKVIGILIIVMIIAVIAIIGVLIYLSSKQGIKQTLYINNEQKEIPQNLLVSDSEGIKYISLEQLSKLLGFEYYNNAYGYYGLDSTKCYIKNGNLISGFELGTNEIYKYEIGTNLDYQYYLLNYDILQYNYMLYISIYDLKTALNIEYLENEKNEIIINTTEYLSTVYQTELTKKGFTLATDENNKKALSYGWLVVSKNGIWGVLDKNYNEIVDLTCSSIYFDEYNLNYIVSNLNGQYGIISSTGEIREQLKYEGLEILNYEEGLYKVKNNSKYGIIRSNGNMLTDIVYDEIGYQDIENNKILYTLIIPKLEEKTEKSIVVKQDKFYGLIKLENGESYLPCDHVEKLYSITELGEVCYKIEAEGITMDLVDYLELREIV